MPLVEQREAFMMSFCSWCTMHLFFPETTMHPSSHILTIDIKVVLRLYLHVSAVLHEFDKIGMLHIIRMLYV